MKRLTVGNIKLALRYVVLIFFMFLAYDITRVEYANEIKSIGEVATSAVYGSVFGALTFILKSHFETKVGEDVK